PGAGQMLRWGVWEPPAYDGAVARGHDDLLVSAALCAVLDRLGWTATGESAAVPVPDALAGIDAGGW
ncbi:MAG: hypothetical protein GX601_07315, partial [Anaerolineales bacterium]|nr:hypothetical protein [Anaerolineales bacterium]